MLASTLTHWEELGVLIASVLTVIGAIWRGIGRPVLKLIEAVGRLEAELKPNGGSSLRDAVNRIEHQQKLMAGRVTNLETRIGHVEE